MKKLFIYLLPFLALGACRNNEPVVNTPKSIVILYENDVHCAIDGYTKMRGLADAIVAADTAYVGLVSSGDFLQGSLAGKTVTADEVTATWTRLEHESGQDQWYEIDEEDKADMCQLWYLLSQMSSDDVINDSAKAAQVRAAEQFGNAVILLNAMAQADSRLSKYTAVWN